MELSWVELSWVELSWVELSWVERAVRVSVRVYPGSKTPRVAGRYGDDEPPVLIVRVKERAEGGKANSAVVSAVAAAFGVPAAAVSIVSGGSGRNKVVEVDRCDPGVLKTLLDRR